MQCHTPEQLSSCTEMDGERVLLHLLAALAPAWRPTDPTTVPMARSLVHRMTKALPAHARYEPDWPYVACVCLFVAVKATEPHHHHLAASDLLRSVPAGTPPATPHELLAFELLCLQVLEWRILQLPDEDDKAVR